jgi:hypothetical protein
LQIGAYNEAEHTEGISLTDVLRPGSHGVRALYNFGDLADLTNAYLPAVQLEDELLRLLDHASRAADKGHEEQKERFLGRYIAVLQKVRGRFLPAVQADALIGIARSL